MPEFEDLKATLTLEPIEVNMFRGISPVTPWPRIFGGQVIAQALMAADNTVPGRICHSLHAYFIRPGDPKIPVLYQVERARDGKSFTTRRVAAIQHGEQIFNLAASFQAPEEGFDHQFTAPALPTPEELADKVDERLAKMPPKVIEMINKRPIEICNVGKSTPEGGPKNSGYASWMRSKLDFGDDEAFNQALLAYASDMGIMETSMRPHDMSFHTPGMQSASLDHAMWFHRPIRFRDWHLYTQDTPSASGARGFTRGSIFSRDGALVASVAQEGLIRHHPPAEG
ncbi:acyl-CoA thioesterase II [soil metagenome]